MSPSPRTAAPPVTPTAPVASPLTPAQFQKQMARCSQGEQRINDVPAHPDDLPSEVESESPIAPEVPLPAPEFPNEPLYRADEAFPDDSLPDAMGNEPEWMTEFNPWIGEAIRADRAMRESSGLYGDLPYIGGVL